MNGQLHHLALRSNLARLPRGGIAFEDVDRCDERTVLGSSNGRQVDLDSADVLKSGRVVFDIGGNKCRIAYYVNFSKKAVYVKFVGTS